LINAIIPVTTTMATVRGILRESLILIILVTFSIQERQFVN
jgi:hypothetical protein